jgi:hypothetical protein
MIRKGLGSELLTLLRLSALERNSTRRIHPQTPTPLNHSTWNLKTLATQLRKNSMIFVIIGAFFIIYKVFRLF